jgi:hypothetical protein
MAVEIMRSELDLFKKIEFQASIENSQFVEFRPTSSIDGTSSIEFEIPVGPDEYLDLQNIFLHTKGHVSDKANASYTATEDNKYSLVNYALNTMFDQLTVYIGGTLVSQSSKTYHYLSYIEALTQSPISAIQTELKSAGFVSTFGNAAFDPEAINGELFNFVKRSKTFSLYGRIHGSIFKSDRLLLNGISMHLMFSRASNEFCLMGSAAITTGTPAPAVEPKLTLSHMSLFVRKVKLSPRLLTAHADLLSKSKAIYPIKRSDIKVVNLPQNQDVFVLDNVIRRQLPCKLIFGLVSNDAYSGSYTKNPFAFKNYNLSEIAIHLNGDLTPKTPYTPNFTDNAEDYSREYYEFLNNLGVIGTVNQPAIDYVNYKKNHCLWAFNLNSDFENPTENEYINLPAEGFLNIEVKFRSNLTEALKLIVYSQFDNSIEIDESRNVTVDYS